MLDDICILGAALKPAQIQKLAHGDEAGAPQSQLIAWWPLDEKPGDQTKDQSGKGRTAELVQNAQAGKRGAIPFSQRFFFFKHEPFIKGEVEFEFQNDEIGDFHIEETKLNIYFPISGQDIIHDMPFGYTAARENEQIFATNWLYCGGLAYVNRGTPKYWVRNGVIANTLAWGGNRFSNRCQWSWTRQRQYNLCLQGRQKIEYYLIPCERFDGESLVHMVENLTAPVFVTRGKGQKSLYEVKDPSLILTSLFNKDGSVYARGYQLPSGGKGRFQDWEIFNTPLRDLEKMPGTNKRE